MHWTCFLWKTFRTRFKKIFKKDAYAEHVCNEQKLSNHQKMLLKKNKNKQKNMKIWKKEVRRSTTYIARKYELHHQLSTFSRLE